MIEKAREAVEAMKETFDMFSKMELPINERNCLLEHEAVTAIINGFQQLERERDEARNDLDTLNYANTELHSAYEAMKRERDAAVEDIRKAAFCGCHVCKHYYRPDLNVRKYSCKKFGDFDKHDFIADDGSIFCGAMEWRGVQEVKNEKTNENTGRD